MLNFAFALEFGYVGLFVVFELLVLLLEESLLFLVELTGGGVVDFELFEFHELVVEFLLFIEEILSLLFG